MHATSLLVLSLAAIVAGSGIDTFDRVDAMLAAHRSGHLERARTAQQQQPPFQLATAKSPYLNSKTKQFAVDGTQIPLVDFDAGESYAGLLPISEDEDNERKLFFWFFPSANVNASEEVTIWFNGGPGCSSLSGLLTENGPILWQAGTLKPVPNPYSWTNLTNMLWVEQPVGVGYSTGVPNITNEVQLAKEFMGFYKNFVNAFDLQKRKVYITGESYAGFYVPYVADQFLKAQDKTYYNLAGIAINDPIIGDDTIQQAVTIVPYVEYWSNLFQLNSTFMTRIRNQSSKCNYTSYQSKYLTFPPPGPLPKLPVYYQTPGCDTFDTVYAAVQEVNPCFNIYHITDYCPFKYGVLGIVNSGDYEPAGGQIYFNRSDVKSALHAPPTSNWLQCTRTNVFGNGTSKGSDLSPPPASNGVLANVIEKTGNVLIGSGDLDFLLMTNGTLLALQNVTWGGVQGLTEPPNQNFYVPYHPEYFGGALAEAGVVGRWVEQRGLTFYSVGLAGHELPGYTPGAGYRMLEKLLGRIPNLSTVGDFTTQKGVFTGHTGVY